MRKTGIYILLGITISLGVFIFTGILYLRPEVQGPTVAKVVPSQETREVPQPSVEPVVEKPKVVQAPAAVQEEPAKVLEEPVEIPAPPRVPPVPSMRMSVSLYEAPQEVVVSEPVVEDVPPVEPEQVEEIPVEAAEERIVEEPAIEEAGMVLPVPEVEDVPLELEVVEDIPVEEVPSEVEVVEDIPVEEVPSEVEVAEDIPVEEVPPEVEVAEEVPMEGVETKDLEELPAEEEEVVEETEVYNIPVRRIPPAPAKATTDVSGLLPQFTPSEPVEFIWTPVEVPEGPVQHVNPVAFNEEAFERRKNAVDEIFDKLIWE